MSLSNSPPTSPLSPSITHSLFIPGSKLTFSIIVCYHPPGLPSRTILDRTYSAQRFFIFSFFFFFGSCGRLSWLNCQLSSASSAHVNITYLLTYLLTDIWYVHESLFTAYLVNFADVRRYWRGIAQCGQKQTSGGWGRFLLYFSDVLYGCPH